MVNPHHRVLQMRSIDPELEVHSVDIEENQTKTKHMERHPLKRKNETEKRPTIADFISTSIQPSADVSSDEVNEESKSHTIDLGYHFTFSEDDESIFHDKEEIGFNIYDSIRAIRKEASKIDAVLAVDQVDRLQEEMKHLRSELQRQNAKTEELTSQVQMKDGQIGTLELERDLYKADTNKLANDLECCLLKLRRVGGTSSPIEIGYGKSHITQTMSETDNTYNPPQLISAGYTSDTSDPISLLDQSTSPLLPPKQHTESPAGTSLTTATTGKISSQTPTSFLLVQEENEYSSRTSEHPVSENKRHIPKEKRGTPQCVIPNRDSDVEIATSVQKGHAKKRFFSFCRPKQPKRNLRSGSMNPISKTTRHESMQKGKRPSKPQTVKQSNTNEKAHLPCGLLHEHVQVMSQRLQSSIKTSEDLRRRIATVHYFYENQVHQLDERIMAVCVERSKLEFETSRRERDACSIAGDARDANQASIPRVPDPHNQATRKSRVVTFNV